MHDIDRTLTEFEFESNGYHDSELEDEFEFEFEFEADEEGGGEFEFEGEYGDEETEEMELAGELLNVSSDQELDEFLGKLIKRAGKAVGKFARSSIGKQLGGVLRNAARKLVPMAGGALGTFFGGPAGGMLGSKLATMASQKFGLELEGLSPEDQEFEVARQFVKFAKDAAKTAVQAPAGMDPSQIVRRAVTQSAQRNAPGLLRNSSSRGGHGRRGSSGRWLRRGNKIILMGA